MKKNVWWTHFLETVLLRNIVLVQALGLCPIVAVSTRLKYGVALTVCTAGVLILTSLCMSLVGEHLPSWLRAPLYTLGATLLLLGAGFWIDRNLSHELYAALYLYLPLMAVNTLFTFCAGTYSVRNKPLPAMLDAVAASCGFGLVICLLSFVRELLAYGTVWDVPLPGAVAIPSAALPFAGFLLLGLTGALLQSVTRRIDGAFGKGGDAR